MSGPTRGTMVVAPAFLRSEIIERDRLRRERMVDAIPYIGRPAPKPEPRWQNDRACRGMDPRLFFTVGRPNVQAREACERCPVKEPCLAAAIVDDADYKESFGYRGGMLPSARTKLRTFKDHKLFRIRERNEAIRREFTERPTSSRDVRVIHLASEYDQTQAYVKRLVHDLA